MREGAELLRTLAVDDDPAILRFLRAGLTSRGHQVIEAVAGRAALDALPQRGPEVCYSSSGFRTATVWNLSGAYETLAPPGDHRRLQPGRRSGQGEGARSLRGRLCRKAVSYRRINGTDPRCAVASVITARREAGVAYR
jgi:hypothetical protein